jgi:hypothetical protein
MSSAPSNRPPRAAALGCRPDIPLITRSSLRVVPAATCSRAHGGYWLRCTAAPEALMAEPGGAVPGSARRRRRTERPPGGHAPNHRAQQMAAAARRPCLRCHAHRQHSRRSQGQVYSGTNAPAEYCRLTPRAPQHAPSRRPSGSVRSSHRTGAFIAHENVGRAGSGIEPQDGGGRAGSPQRRGSRCFAHPDYAVFTQALGPDGKLLMPERSARLGLRRWSPRW